MKYTATIKFETTFQPSTTHTQTQAHTYSVEHGKNTMLLVLAAHASIWILLHTHSQLSCIHFGGVCKNNSSFWMLPFVCLFGTSSSIHLLCARHEKNEGELKKKAAAAPHSTATLLRAEKENVRVREKSRKFFRQYWFIQQYRPQKANINTIEHYGRQNKLLVKLELFAPKSTKR